MKNNLTKLIILLLALCTVVTFAACVEENQHEHKYTWYQSKKVTCTENGSLEGICECGYKTFEDIVAVGHDFHDGICTECGAIKESQEQEGNKVEEGQSIGLTLEDVYEKFKNFGYEQNFGQFVANLSQIYLNEIKIDLLNELCCLLKYSSDDQLNSSITIPNVKVNYNLNNTQQLKNLYGLRVISNELFCIFADGTELSLGLVKDNIRKPDIKVIRSVFINQDNIFGVVYADDTLEVIAKVASTDTEIKGSQLIYKKIKSKNEYEVVGILNRNDTNLEIPKTHLGLPVTRIAAYAFYNCSSLTSVTIPKSIIIVGNYAFYSCASLTDIYCEAEREPSGWSFYWNYVCDAKVHWGE